MSLISRRVTAHFATFGTYSMSCRELHSRKFAKRRNMACRSGTLASCDHCATRNGRSAGRDKQAGNVLKNKKSPRWGLFNIWGRSRSLARFCLNSIEPYLLRFHSLGSMARTAIQRRALGQRDVLDAATIGMMYFWLLDNFGCGGRI
ncbi:hypothetical protein D3C80_1495700 [compost metagenome]